MTNVNDIDGLLAQLTLTEKCAMVNGANAFEAAGCERLGIPGWRLADGAAGAKGADMGPTLVTPSASAQAATWDTDLVRALGEALAEESIDRHIDMLLAPTVNLHRSPRGGRHFECFSEDPELSARMAVAYITGLQSRGVSCCVKHFVCNDQEFERMTIDVRVDERTLREVYLRPFEAAVREAGARSLMAAYNYVNGHHATAQPDLLDRVLKREWGFDGVVVSDWGSMKETLAPALHGLDLEMPGPGRWWGDGLLQAAVESGSVPESLLDDKVRRILELLVWRGRLPGAPVAGVGTANHTPAHRAVVRRAAAASMVLVKNDGPRPLLPLAAGASIALIGPGVAHTALAGGGSADATPYQATNLLDAFREGWDGPLTYEIGIDLRRRTPTLPWTWMPDGIRLELFAGDGFDGEPVAVEQRMAVYNVLHSTDYGVPGGMSVRATFTMVPDVSGAARMMAANMGTCRAFVDGELIAHNETDSFFAGMGLRGGAGSLTLEAGRRYSVVLEARPHPGSDSPYALIDAGIALVGADRPAAIAAAVDAAAAADVAVVVVGSNNEWESEGADRDDLDLPMDQDELVRRVIAANPRTVVVLNCGAPMNLPWLADVPAALLVWYPGQEGGNAIFDVLTGAAEPGGRMPTTWARAERDTPSFGHYPGEGGVVRYDEGVLVGHRWYDVQGIEPLIPFGHGRSYTSCTWGAATVGGTGTDIVVEVPVTNTGDRPGSEVVQVYVASPAAEGVPSHARLAGFAKLHLSAGATAVARIVLGEVAFRRWDTAAGSWTVDSGDHQVIVAASAVDRRHEVTHTIGSFSPRTTTRQPRP